MWPLRSTLEQAIYISGSGEANPERGVSTSYERDGNKPSLVTQRFTEDVKKKDVKS